MQGSLNLYLTYIDPPVYCVSIPLTVLLKFQHHTKTPHPSFDLPQLVEIRAMVHLDGYRILDDTNVAFLFSMWNSDELIHLECLESLKIGMYLNDNNPFGEPEKPQMELEDYLEDLGQIAHREPDFASDVLNRLGRGFEPLRKCNRRYELQITLDGFPIDDVLCELEGIMGPLETEEDVEGTEKGTESRVVRQEAEGPYKDPTDSK